MYGDARSWDEGAYRQAILKEREVQTRTVFRTAWAPTAATTPDSFFVASSDGILTSYSLSALVSESARLRGTTTRDLLVAEPQGFLQGHDGPAYDLKFYGDGEDPLLLSCGDDGRIRGWKWNEFRDSDIRLNLQGNRVKPFVEMINPQHKGPWGALSPIPENNAIAIDSQTRTIFSAAGDSCAYSWDVETGKIKMVFKGHSEYLHCIVARNSSGQIVTGSEDGTARIWDCKTGRCVKVIRPTKEEFKSFVSCVALDKSESWLVCGSGRSLSLWNLTAAECVSTIPVPAIVQDAVFDENQIIAVGAEPFLRRFTMNGAVLSQIQCAPHSAFSASLHTSGVVAVGGYEGLVDVISQFGSHLCTFRC